MKIAIITTATRNWLSFFSFRHTSLHSVAVGCSISSTSPAAPSTVLVGLLIGDPRVDPGAQQVHHQDGEHDEDGTQHHKPDDQRTVLRPDPGDECVAQSGRLKMVSVRTAPAMRYARSRPKIVTIGTKEFLRTWRPITRWGGRPRAFAARMCSPVMLSKMADRPSRPSDAADKTPIVRHGRT